MLDLYLIYLVYLGVMRKTRLTKENRNRWFEYACFTGEPIKNNHHIIPKHHGGDNSPSNLIKVDVKEHALLHKKIWEDTGCQTCYKDYRSLMGVYKTWVKKSKIYKLKNNEVDWYRLDNPNDPLKNYDSYESGVFENEHFPDPTDGIMKESMAEEVLGALETLSGRERIILEMYYGFKPEYRKEEEGVNYPPQMKTDGMTLYEIGKEFDITQDRVSQIKIRAIQRLRHRSRSTTLRRYLG